MKEAMDDLQSLILVLHDTKKGQTLDKSAINTALVDFMGSVLKGLDFSQRIRDNTEFNLTNIK